MTIMLWLMAGSLSGWLITKIIGEDDEDGGTPERMEPRAVAWG